MFLIVKMERMMECINNVVNCSRRSWVVASSDVFDCKKRPDEVRRVTSLQMFLNSVYLE